MLKIAVIGGNDTVIGFKAVGLEACPADNAAEALQALRDLTKEGSDYAIIYIEEKLAQEMRSKPTRQAVYATPRDRYIALLKAQKNGVTISENDEDFMLEYEMNMDDDELFYISSIV